MKGKGHCSDDGERDTGHSRTTQALESAKCYSGCDHKSHAVYSEAHINVQLSACLRSAADTRGDCERNENCSETTLVFHQITHFRPDYEEAWRFVEHQLMRSNHRITRMYQHTSVSTRLQSM